MGLSNRSVNQQKYNRSSLKRKVPAIKRPPEVTHIDKVKRLQEDKYLFQGKCEFKYSECSSTFPFIFDSQHKSIEKPTQPYTTDLDKETNFLRRQVLSDTSLVSLGKQTKKLPSPTLNQNNISAANKVQSSTESYPTFYISSEDQTHYQRLKTLINPKTSKNNDFETINKMRGTSLRNGGRPANSMEQDSFDSFDDMEDMLVVSTTNSLNLNNPNLSTGSSSTSPNVAMRGLGPGTEDELPKSIIVTNVDRSVFNNSQVKAHFESLFRDFEVGAAFHYLPSFRRIRVDFESHLSASNAKQHMDSTIMGENTIHCYFIQVLSPCTDEEAFLHVPPLEKQFLISPPCSPPVGWEQPREDKPVVDYDLLTAMAQLSPGKNHELHPSKEVTLLGKSISTPSIVVHVCAEEENGLLAKSKVGVRPKNTACPSSFRQNSLE